MTIYESIRSMKQEIITTSQMLNEMSIVELVADLAVRVKSIDPVTFEYAVANSDKVLLRTSDQAMFCKFLEWWLS